MDITVPQGTPFTITTDFEGNTVISGLPEKVEPEPPVLTVARFTIKGVEVCAFSVNSNSGPNWRAIRASEGRDLIDEYDFRENGSWSVTWGEINKFADEGSLRTYSPRPQTQAPKIDAGQIRVSANAIGGVRTADPF